MSEPISIQNAPAQYRPYLLTADKKGNNNGEIDSEDEAKWAVNTCKEGEFCINLKAYFESYQFQLTAESLKDAEYYYRLGNAFEERNMLDKAIESFKASIKIDPDNVKSHVNLGATFGEKGEIDLAIKEFERAIEIDPKSVQAYSGLGNAYREKGELGLAVEKLKKAISIDPHNAEAHYNLGIAFADNNELNLAIEEIRKAIEEFSKISEVHPNIVESYKFLGILFKRKGDFDLAIREFEKALRIDPNHAETHNGLGGLYYQRGDFDLSIIEYQKAIQSNPSLAVVHQNLAYSYIKKGEWTSDVEYFRKAADEFEVTEKLGRPIPPEIKKQLQMKIARLERNKNGNTEEIIVPSREDELKALDKTKGILDKELKQDPLIQSKRYFDLAEQYFFKDELQKALACYQKAAEIDLKSEAALLGIWRTYKELGDKQKAKAACEKYAKASKEDISCE